MTVEKAEKLAQLIFQTAPPFRKNYIKQPEQAMGLPRLPHHHLFCLIILSRGGKMTMGSLAEKMGVSVQQLTRIVGELEAQGFAERTQSEESRRVTLVSATVQGRELLSKFYRAACEHVRGHFAALSEEDIDALIFHMGEVVKLLDKLDT